MIVFLKEHVFLICILKLTMRCLEVVIMIKTVKQMWQYIQYVMCGQMHLDHACLLTDPCK